MSYPMQLWAIAKLKQVKIGGETCLPVNSVRKELNSCFIGQIFYLNKQEQLNKK
jgi:hypothetical protein